MTRAIDHALPRCFVVRIYRSKADRPEQLLGLVEEVGKENKRPFRNLDELWQILNPHKRKKSRKAAGEGPVNPRSSNPKGGGAL